MTCKKNLSVVAQVIYLFSNTESTIILDIISSLALGENLQVKDLPEVDGVTFVTPEDSMIVSCVGQAQAEDQMRRRKVAPQRMNPSQAKKRLPKSQARKKPQARKKFLLEKFPNPFDDQWLKMRLSDLAIPGIVIKTPATT